MPQLKPMTPVRYSAERGADLSAKIAPPYDVLDEGPKQALLAGDPHNIVAIDLPVTPPKTVGPDAAYAEAGELYRQWLAEGVLQRDDEPAVLAYEQVYELQGQTVRRRGLFAVLGVEEFNRPGGGIFRHEMTLAGGIGDRTKLMQATSAQLSPIFGIYSDPQAAVAELLVESFNSDPHFTATTANDGVEHRCWWVTAPGTLAALSSHFEGTDVFIADGHHRYTTALEFSKSHPELPGADGCLFVLVAAEDPGMIVLATHRVITGMTGFTLEKLRTAVAQRDDLKLVEGDAAAEAPFRIIDPATGDLYGLTLPAEDPLAATHADRPEVWRTLDVAILQHLIVEQVLQPAFGGDEPLTYKYTAEDAEARSLAAQGDPGTRVAVLMRATPLQSVMDVSRADDVMPPKSTFFYPKLATGLVVNPLD